MNGKSFGDMILSANHNVFVMIDCRLECESCEVVSLFGVASFGTDTEDHA
jgi:hypothetical protein